MVLSCDYFAIIAWRVCYYYDIMMLSLV